MTSVATTIFKVRAHTDFIASDSNKDLLSFRKGQPFYALSTDLMKKTYFVSTQFAVPFSRSSVTGIVPIEFFDKVDLLSRDPPVQKRKPLDVRPATTWTPNVAAPKLKPVVAATPALTRRSMSFQAVDKEYVSTPHPCIPEARKKSLPTSPESLGSISALISSLAVLSLSSEGLFSIKLTRENETFNMAHIITRSIPEFIALAAAAGQAYPGFNNIAYPLSFPEGEKRAALESYLVRLTVSMSFSCNADMGRARDSFFNPKSSLEFVSGQIVRRDSGTAEDGESNPNQKSHNPKKDLKITASYKKSYLELGVPSKRIGNPFTAFSKMVFG